MWSAKCLNVIRREDSADEQERHQRQEPDEHPQALELDHRPIVCASVPRFLALRYLWALDVSPKLVRRDNSTGGYFRMKVQ